MLTVIFGVFLFGSTVYCWRAPDLAIPNTMTLLIGVWLASIYALMISPAYPVAFAVLVDCLACLFVLRKEGQPRIDDWQIWVAILFASQVLCHIAYFLNITVYGTEPNVSLYLNLLAMLAYAQIFVVAGAKWLDGPTGKKLGKLSLVGSLRSRLLHSREWNTKTHKGTKA